MKWRMCITIEAHHWRRDGLADDRVLVLLAEVVGDDALDALREAHLLDLLVLDVTAQPEAYDKLIKRHRLRL